MTDKLPLLDEPNEWAGCYTLDLYCKYDHGWKNPFGQYTGRTHSICAAQAKRDGWVIDEEGTASCPSCAKANKL